MIKETNFEFKLDYLCIAIVAAAMLVAGIVPIIGKAATFIGVHYGTPLNVAQHKRPVYGDDEGREYDYYLTIEVAHFEAFVSLLMRRCQVQE